jgi:tRNA A-37 threonylcarbamoyl transferase component Bud32
LNNDFDKIRLKSWTIYIHKNFRNKGFEQALLAGEEELQKHYRSTAIGSSQFARVYKLTVGFNGVERGVYFKQYLYRSGCDFIKHLVRASRAKRAFNATKMLAENGFGAPAIVAMGERKPGLFHTRNFLVTLEVEGAKQIHQLVADRSENLTKEQLRDKRELIGALGQTIGRMHTKDIFHGDLRLGNVLARQESNGWQFFFLDNERTKKFRRLPVRLCLKNLVQLNMFRSATMSNTDRMRFFKKYLTENGKSKEEGKALIHKVVEKTKRRLSKRRELKKGLKKCLRTNEKYLRIKTGKYLTVFDRYFCQGAEPLDFIKQADAMMDDGRILKNGDTCYVSRLTWNGKDVAVKRYNHKGFIHSLRHTIKKSRAHRGWLHGHWLGMLNIATPRPLAYIEQRRGTLVWKSYLVTQYVRGRTLHNLLKDSSASKEQRAKVTQEFKELLDRLGKYRISHGDLKHTNILITENGPVLTDLDGMKTHRCGWLYKISHTRDVERFVKEGPNNNAIPYDMKINSASCFPITLTSKFFTLVLPASPIFSLNCRFSIS